MSIHSCDAIEISLSLIVLIVALRSPSCHAADPQRYRVEIVSTADGTLDSTLTATSQLRALRELAPVDPFGLIARARGDVLRLEKVLQSRGYYQGSISILINGVALDDPRLGEVLSAVPQGREALCRISAGLGPLYHLGRVDIDGVVPEEGRRSLGLSSGAPAAAAEVLAGGARLLSALWDQGFAFAKVDPPIAYPDSQRHVLDLSFHVETGPRVRIGVVRFTGLKSMQEAKLRTRLLLHPGDPYSATKVDRARKDLLDMGVFTAVSVRLGSPPDDAGLIPVTFQVQERPRREIGLSAAYSTDLGGSGGITWLNRDLFGRAEQLSLSATAINLGGDAATGVGYDLGVRYVVPDLGRRDQSVQFAVEALKQSLEAYDQTAQTAAVTVQRRLSSVWSASAGVSTERSTVVQEGETHDYTLLAAPLRVSYDSTDLLSPLDDPRHGMRGALSLAPTVSFGNPNSEFLVIQLTLAAYIDLDTVVRTEPGRSVLALRLLGGLAKGAGDLGLPPDQRFYAGGSGTIRGYRYQSVGPQFADGNPMGGTAINVLGVEFRQRFGADFGAAAFVDAGRVGDSANPDSGVSRVGAGVGARYYTSIGPIRADIAFPVHRRPGDDSLEIYIGLGQAF
jgi:translocation and assembly module TamA